MSLVRPLGREALEARRSEKWADQGPGVIASTIAEMDVEIAEPIAEVLRAALARHDLGYTPANVRPMAEAFAGFAARRMAWGVDPEQVVPVTDVMVGVAALCRVLAEPGDAVAFASPNYPPFFAEIRREGVTVREIGLRGDGALDLDDLDAALAKGVSVLVLTNPHNPTGRVAPRAELEAIADRCAARDAWVVADEIHAPLTLAGATHVPWLEVSDAARARGVALTSASKAFNLAALKCAVAVTASGAARDAVARLGDQSDHVGLLGVLAAEAAFVHGDAWLDELLGLLHSNRARLGERLDTDLPDVRWTPPQASFVAWLDCRGMTLDREPAEAFGDVGVALSPGSAYGASGTGHARLNFGTSPAILEETLDRMARLAR